MKKIVGLFAILTLTACQLTANENTNTAEETKEKTTVKAEVKSDIPALPASSEYDGFIVYFKDGVDSKAVFTELEKEVETKINIELAYPEDNKYVIKLDLPKATDEETDAANQAISKHFWTSLNQNTNVKIAELNLMMTIGM